MGGFAAFPFPFLGPVRQGNRHFSLLDVYLHVEMLTSEMYYRTSSIKRDGSDKVWSDEVARNLVLVRLLLSGVAVIFDQKADIKSATDPESGNSTDIEMIEANGYTPEDSSESSEIPEQAAEESEEDEVKPTFKYPTGYSLKEDHALYQEVHDLRARVRIFQALFPAAAFLQAFVGSIRVVHKGFLLL